MKFARIVGILLDSLILPEIIRKNVKQKIVQYFLFKPLSYIHAVKILIISRLVKRWSLLIHFQILPS